MFNADNLADITYGIHGTDVIHVAMLSRTVRSGKGTSTFRLLVVSNYL